ncbi:MAG: hybrid sensor histidine kinase/response regulator [Gemmatimonadetes bacterium]|nr:hybrid sensor histidine kinase/response regulator [Gemmatimonadota bacterium]
MSSWTDFQNRRILTVDDSRAVRIFLLDILTQHGAEVEEAASGREALERWASGGRYDLVLLDLILPDLDGIEVLRQIRQTDSETPVVVLTGAGGIESATAAVRQGADGYIEKQHLDAEGDATAFLYALQQAVEHRAGFVAQQQLQEMKADFYSMVTHDLRNPAGNVWGVIRMLLSGKAGPLTPRQEQLLGIAQTSASRLVGLINDYLDFAKLDAGFLRLDRRDAELCEVVRAGVLQAEPQAQVRQQTLSVTLPRESIPAHVDPERLEQVLDNLISNAIKYTPDGGGIEVALERRGEEALLRVRDTGQGIPPEQLPALFAKYHRVPGEATRGIQGTGLGLLIVKEIVEAHGGTVHAESEGRGQGTTFVVAIPLGGER